MTLKNDNQLAGEWENFERNVVPVDAGAAQRLQMRVAFYAGAASLMKVLRVIDDSLPDDVGLKILESVDRELRQFAVHVQEGRH